MSRKLSRESLPSSGPASGCLDLRDDNGNLIQRRYFDLDGRASKNIDFGHDHTGDGDPHVHDWDWTLTPPRQPARPIRPEEVL